ncbi:MAG: hypothetical protein ACK49J_05130 [Verrucomicrobiota bacterium]|jgi:hypothetical protein
MIELPIAWILGTIGTLSGAVATLAALMWNFMKSRLEAQDRVINAQSATIEKLQGEVERMAAGCGVIECHWKRR